MVSGRYSRLPAFPTEVAPADLYDGDVIQESDGRCLTVLQAWHGEAGVVARCVPGAFKLSDAGAGFGYDGPVSEFGDVNDRLVLTGSLELDEGLRLRPSYRSHGAGQPVEAHWVSRPTEGALVIAADGYPYRIIQRDGGLEFEQPWEWAGPARYAGRPVDSYLESVTLPQRGFVVMAPMSEGPMSEEQPTT